MKIKSFTASLHRLIESDLRQHVAGGMTVAAASSAAAGAALAFHWDMLRGTPLAGSGLIQPGPSEYPATSWLWTGLGALLGFAAFLLFRKGSFDRHFKEQYQKSLKYLLESPLMPILLSEQAYERLPSLGQGGFSSGRKFTDKLQLGTEQQHLLSRFKDLLRNFDAVKGDLGWKDEDERPASDASDFPAGCGGCTLRTIGGWLAGTVISMVTIAILEYFSLPYTPFPSVWDWASSRVLSLAASGLQVNQYNFWGSLVLCLAAYGHIITAAMACGKRRALIDFLQGDY